MSHDMTIQTKWASTQSDQSLRCPHEESLGPKLPIKPAAKTMIRLGRCSGWSESSLGEHSFCWFCHVVADMELEEASDRATSMAQLNGLAFKDTPTTQCFLTHWPNHTMLSPSLAPTTQCFHHHWPQPHNAFSITGPNHTMLSPSLARGARWLSGRVSDSGARGPGFETYRRRVVSLSKTLYSPKVLVNYPGSDGSVPIWLKNCWLGR